MKTQKRFKSKVLEKYEVFMGVFGFVFWDAQGFKRNEPFFFLLQSFL